MKKLATGSIFTTQDQARFYEEQMGIEATARQLALADAAAGRCTCTTAKVKRRWEGGDKPTTRTVHDADCAKWKPWMSEVRP